ncbi:hypothetical protein NCCP28_35620 [Niallia sp. NCCP-28]|nr:hypothetical protein NCCP28_35620 [Niallia sp. NCCP-28]
MKYFIILNQLVQSIWEKLIVIKEKIVRVLGVQIVVEEGVDKRIDVFCNSSYV